MYYYYYLLLLLFIFFFRMKMDTVFFFSQCIFLIFWFWAPNRQRQWLIVGDFFCRGVECVYEYYSNIDSNIAVHYVGSKLLQDEWLTQRRSGLEIMTSLIRNRLKVSSQLAIEAAHSGDIHLISGKCLSSVGKKCSKSTLRRLIKTYSSSNATCEWLNF